MTTTDFARSLLKLWNDAHELDIPQIDFATWSGATKDLLLALGLEWQGDEYVIPWTDAEESERLALIARLNATLHPFADLQLHVRQRVRVRMDDGEHEGKITIIERDRVYVTAPQNFMSFDRESWDARVLEVEDFGPDEWVVGVFDENKLRGTVNNGVRQLDFHSTSFQANSCFRWPRAGEAVEVVFTKKGEILSVHEKESISATNPSEGEE